MRHTEAAASGRHRFPMRLVTIEAAAHVSWADDPATVFASIRQFLREEWPLAASR